MKKRAALVYFILIGSLLAIHNPVFSMKRSRPSSWPEGRSAYSRDDVDDMDDVALNPAVAPDPAVAIPLNVAIIPDVIDALAGVWIAANPDPATIVTSLRHSGYPAEYARAIMRAIRRRAIIFSNRSKRLVSFEVYIQGKKREVSVHINQRCFLDLGQETSALDRIEITLLNIWSKPEVFPEFPMVIRQHSIPVKGGVVVRILPTAFSHMRPSFVVCEPAI